jgi:subtilisin family serine protease
LKKLLAAAGLAVLISGTFVAPATAATTSVVPNSWGLDRIDQAGSELDNAYSYPESGGAGVRVYVLDTGVQGDIASFGGRVESGFDATSRYGGVGNTDCHGHGTHVAGTIASSDYGVAPKATIVPIRVANCRGGVSSTWIENGLKWVLDNHPAGTPGVVNLSVATTYRANVNEVADKLYRAGIVVVAASGNYNMDACRLSPGSTDSILTVGSVNINSYKTNRTTYGSCIDIYAPGGTITSTDPKLGSKVRTGTSMASPHVAGAAALYLADHPSDRAEVVNHLLIRYATEGVIPNITSGVNKLLNIGFINERSGSSAAAPTPAPEVPVVEESEVPVVVEPEVVEQAPTKDAISDAVKNFYVMGGSRTMTMVWDAPANIDNVDLIHYRVEFSYNNGRSWRLLARVEPTDTQAETRKPPRGRTVSFRVIGVTEAGYSDPSTKVSVRIS